MLSIFGCFSSSIKFFFQNFDLFLFYIVYITIIRFNLIFLQNACFGKRN